MVSYGYDKVLMLCCLRHLILLFLTSFAIYLSRFCKSELYQDWHFFSPRSGFQYFVLHILLITFLRIKTLSRLVFQNKPLVITMTKGFSFYNIFKNDDRKSDVCKQASLLLSLRFFSCKPKALKLPKKQTKRVLFSFSFSFTSSDIYRYTLSVIVIWYIAFPVRGLDKTSSLPLSSSVRLTETSTFP